MEAIKSEDDCPLTFKEQRETQHKSSPIHVPAFWSLLLQAWLLKTDPLHWTFRSAVPKHISLFDTPGPNMPLFKRRNVRNLYMKLSSLPGLPTSRYMSHTLASKECLHACCAAMPGWQPNLSDLYHNIGPHAPPTEARAFKRVKGQQTLLGL